MGRWELGIAKMRRWEYGNWEEMQEEEVNEVKEEGEPGSGRGYSPKYPCHRFYIIGDQFCIRGVLG